MVQNLSQGRGGGKYIIIEIDFSNYLKICFLVRFGYYGTFHNIQTLLGLLQKWLSVSLQLSVKKSTIRE